MQMCIAGLSISFGLFINYVLDLCVISENIKNLLIICFSFGIISLLKYLFNYLLTLYNSRYLKEEYYFYKDKVFKQLFNKTSAYFFFKSFISSPFSLIYIIYYRKELLCIKLIIILTKLILINLITV